MQVTAAGTVAQLFPVKSWWRKAERPTVDSHARSRLDVLEAQGAKSEQLQAAMVTRLAELEKRLPTEVFTISPLILVLRLTLVH